LAVPENSKVPTLCIGDAISFDGRASAFGQGRITAYEWVFGTGATPATSRSANPGAVMYDEPGVKTVALTVTTEEGCRVSMQGETTQLETEVMQAIGAVQYQWTPATLVSCVDCPNPTITPEENTTVVVMITDENGCEASDSLLIEVEPIEIMEISIPSAFTPNGDGFNDGFTANNIPLGEDELGWNGDYQGERLQPDVFIYRAVIAKADGEVADFTGDIMLIR